MRQFTVDIKEGREDQIVSPPFVQSAEGKGSLNALYVLRFFWLYWPFFASRKVSSRLALGSQNKLTIRLRNYPTEHCTILELQNPSIDVFEDLKMWKGLSGSSACIEALCTECVQMVGFDWIAWMTWNDVQSAGAAADWCSVVVWQIKVRPQLGDRCKEVMWYIEASARTELNPSALFPFKANCEFSLVN